ncbi:MAG: GGDEF domain-containing protein [Treponema sp.]|nr:GGDEF domain-containing protein [Treponema sp.]
MTKQEQYRTRILIALIVSAILLSIMLCLIFPVLKELNTHTTRLVLAGTILLLVIFAFIILQFYKKRRVTGENETSQKNIIDALSSIYENVYIVNLKTHALSICNLSNIIDKKYRNAFKDILYEDAFKLYAQNEVYEEDRTLFASIIDTGKISALLENKAEHSFIYRVKRDEKIHFYQCFAFRPNSDSNEAILAFKNVNNMMSEKLKSERKLTTLLENQSKQLAILSAIAKSYLTAHLIDIQSDTIVELKTSQAVRQVVHESTNARNQMNVVFKHTSTPEFLLGMLEFTDLATIAERMKGKVSISTEFEGKFNGWVRASFITVEADKEEKPTKVLFTTQIIDDEKRKEEILMTKATTDELTHLLNRSAYEEAINRYEKEPLPNDIVFVSMDVNGLKDANDTFGHDAGDELIRGAAFCITACFSPYGALYRTGGDEFQAIIFADGKTVDKIRGDFERIVGEWSGNRIKELSISAGYAPKCENPNLCAVDLIKLADQRMYNAKSKHYARLGLDRRGRQMAFEMLFKSYEKILKINLTTDTFSVIHLNSSPQDAFMDFDKLSESLDSFRTSPLIHKDDAEKVALHLDIHSLRSYLKNSKDIFSIQYRKKSGDTFHTTLLEIIPTPEYTDTNQVAFLYVKNIEKKDDE